MPTILSPNLTLTTTDDETTISVTYVVTFTMFEKALADAGVEYHSHIDVFGPDPAGSLTGAVLMSFPTQTFPTLEAAVPILVVARGQSMTVSRSRLQEDAALGDADEIRCKIRIHAVGVPAEFTPYAFTDQETLQG